MKSRTGYIPLNHGHRVTHRNHRILSPEMLDVYATTIYNKGAVLECCFGFIDGTVRPIRRPVINQRTVYNRHKRVHALKFQSVALPSGLIWSSLWCCGCVKFMLLLFFPVLTRFDFSFLQFCFYI